MATKRRSFTISFKLEVLKYAEETSGEAAARKFNVTPSTIRGWKKLKTSYEKFAMWDPPEEDQEGQPSKISKLRRLTGAVPGPKTFELDVDNAGGDIQIQIQFDVVMEKGIAFGKTFAKLLSIPSISKCHFTESKEGIVSVHSEWTSDDVTTKSKNSFAKSYTLLKPGSTAEKLELVHESLPISLNSKLTCAHLQGFLTQPKNVLTATVIGGKDDISGDILQIFSKDKLEKTFDLKELGLPKDIYTNPQWGCTMTWSSDGSKLAYLAERKTPKATSYFAPYGKLTSSNGNDVETDKKCDYNGDEFAFRQSWGEQLTDAFESVIVVLDIHNDEFRVLDLPDKIFPCDLQWVGSSFIVGTGYTASKEGWRLGLIYCSNRESRIFKIGSSGENFKYLSEAGISAFSPRVRPDGKFIVWEERIPVGGPHDNSRAVVGMKLEEGETKYTIYKARPDNKIPIYASLPQNCWTVDGARFLICTPNESESILLSFHISEEQVLIQPEVTRDVSRILWIGKNYVLISRSNTLESQSLHLLDISNLSKSHDVCLGLRPISQEMKRVVIDSFSPASFYYGPSGSISSKSVPLVVMPHGGPHSVLTDEFTPEMAFLLHSGFGVLRINYIGSIGGSSDPEELCGKIGSADLKHCQAIVNHLLKDEFSVNPDKIVVFGGSHGGFLGAHLTSSFPDTYKAAALRNPVTDLVSIVSTSDITDWAYVENCLPHEPNVYLPYVGNTKDAEKLMELSPIRHAEKVKASTLLLLGSEDVRVPMSQGLAYYRALQHFNKDAEVRLYNDCHSLAKKVPCRFDVMIQVVLWFKKHLEKS